jgi:hypothetical protein
MRTSVFLSPYEKVFRRTKRALSRMGMRIVKSDAEGHTIAVQSSLFSWKPAMSIVLNFEDIDGDCTRVTVESSPTYTPLFRQPKCIKREVEILEILSVAV